MQHRELVRLLAQYAEVSDKRAAQLLHLATAIVAAALQEGEGVHIESLGTFAAYWAPATRRNKHGRGLAPVGAHWNVRFKPSPRLLYALRRERKPPKVELWGAAADGE